MGMGFLRKMSPGLMRIQKIQSLDPRSWSGPRLFIRDHSNSIKGLKDQWFAGKGFFLLGLSSFYWWKTMIQLAMLSVHCFETAATKLLL
jgi:hypothetical protein